MNELDSLRQEAEALKNAIRVSVGFILRGLFDWPVFFIYIIFFFIVAVCFSQESEVNCVCVGVYNVLFCSVCDPKDARKQACDTTLVQATTNMEAIGRIQMRTRRDRKSVV